MLAALATLIHLLFNHGYGYFRDELYLAVCGQHLAWGYVDHAPLISSGCALHAGHFGRFSRRICALCLRYQAQPRWWPRGWMAREMGGGGRFAQFFAALTTLIAPIYLTFDNFLSMNAFEPVFWMLCAAVVVRILNGEDRRLWLLFGLVAGLGLLNKHSMLFFGSGLALGLLLTVPREFTHCWIWLGTASRDVAVSAEPAVGDAHRLADNRIAAFGDRAPSTRPSHRGHS